MVRPTSQTAHLENLGVELIHGDLDNVQSLKAAVKGVERVYHCAALATDWGAREEFHTSNVNGVRNLLDATAETEVNKFIHISTTDVYGHPDYPADESAPHRLRGWPYGDTKIKGEKLVWMYHQQRGLPVTVVRPVNVYGPRSTSFVLEIVDLLKSGGMVHIGPGHKPAGLGYAANVVDVILRAADSKSSIGQAYNASDGSNVTWRQYVDRLAEIVGVPSPRLVIPYRVAYMLSWAMEKAYGTLRIKSRPLLTRMAVELLGTDQGFSIEKARQELGYKPEVNLDEGIRQVEAWLRQTDYIS
ncbi:MAG: NAD-dependent epimerase/dehydratase family protein [Chloroflexi bacterium]|nr:NAD-dependent epimerase/dehydratase family protein [Chloroflexota bacterium]